MHKPEVGKVRGVPGDEVEFRKKITVLMGAREWKR